MCVQDMYMERFQSRPTAEMKLCTYDDDFGVFHICCERSDELRRSQMRTGKASLSGVRDNIFF